jgi:flagellar biosynthesis anti-sigma factor FlgM
MRLPKSGRRINDCLRICRYTQRQEEIGEFMRVDFTTFGVEPPENSKTGGAGPAGNSGRGATSSTAGSSTAGVDQTRFSFDPARIQSLQAQVLAQPEIRDAKVRSLQQAIGSGEYSVPASHVAAALINELGGGAQG